MISNAWSMGLNFGLEASTHWPCCRSTMRTPSAFGLMTAALHGRPSRLHGEARPLQLGEVIRAESVQVTSVVPTLLPMLLAAGVTAEKVPTLRHILVSSAPLSTDLARDFETRTRIPLIQGWGLSEYSNFACCVSPDGSAADHARGCTAGRCRRLDRRSGVPRCAYSTQAVHRPTRASAASWWFAATRRWPATFRIQKTRRAPSTRRLVAHRRRRLLPARRGSPHLLRHRTPEGNHHPRCGEAQPLRLERRLVEALRAVGSPRGARFSPIRRTEKKWVPTWRPTFRRVPRGPVSRRR